MARERGMSSQHVSGLRGGRGASVAAATAGDTAAAAGNTAATAAANPAPSSTHGRLPAPVLLCARLVPLPPRFRGIRRCHYHCNRRDACIACAASSPAPPKSHVPAPLALLLLCAPPAACCARAAPPAVASAPFLPPPTAARSTRLSPLTHQGAAIEAKNNDGWTPLLCASYMGHLEMVQWLVSEVCRVIMFRGFGAGEGRVSLLLLETLLLLLLTLPFPLLL